MGHGQFKITDTGYLTGYGQLCVDTAEDCTQVASFVAGYATSDSRFGGQVMGALADPVDSYAQAMQDRVNDRRWALEHTDAELNSAAWTYADVDADAAGRFSQFDPYGQVENPFVGTMVPTPRANDIAGQLDAPSTVRADIEKVIEENTDFTLESINDLVATVTSAIPGVSTVQLVETYLGALVGDDWGALEEKGTALERAGNAVEDAAENLVQAIGHLSQQWHGGAAQDFTAYMGRLTRAMEYEGALNRIVAMAYKRVAELIEYVAGKAVELLNEGVEMLRKYVTGTKKFEFAADLITNIGRGIWDMITQQDINAVWNRVKQTWAEAEALFNDARALVDTLSSLPDELRSLIEAAQDPVGAVTDAINEQIEPIRQRLDEAIDDGQGLVDLGPDLVTVSRTNDLADAPDGGFELGDRPRRDGQPNTPGIEDHKYVVW